MEIIEGTGPDGPDSQTYLRSSMSFLKEQGLFGIFAALLLSIAISLAFSYTNAPKKKQNKRGVIIDTSGEPGLAMRNIKFDSLIREPWPGADTIVSLFEQACEKFSKHPYLGTRTLISRDFASGIVRMGHDLNSRVAIFSDTRAEWLIASQGCFRQSITVVTIYASLGEDALVHSLNETQVSVRLHSSSHNPPQSIQKINYN